MNRQTVEMAAKARRQMEAAGLDAPEDLAVVRKRLDDPAPGGSLAAELRTGRPVKLGADQRPGS